MNESLAKTILPPYWRGVTKNHASIQESFILSSFDTETCYGRVFALGFCHPSGRVEISYGLGANHLDFLLARLFTLPSSGRGTFVCGAHNLVFDLGVIFWEVVNPLCKTRHSAPRKSYFSLLKSRVEVEIFWTRPCFAKFKRDGRTIHLIDSFAFFMMSLRRALQLIGGTVQKAQKPSNLGKVVIPLMSLRKYLTADSQGVLELLKAIVKLHEKYQTRLCVSLPQLSGRIFRHRYLRGNFARLPKPLIRGSLLSYHGGKNTFIGSPGWYADCYDLDINSAYPEAMSALPDLENGTWNFSRGIAAFRRAPIGIFLVSGRVLQCAYGIAYNHDFKKIRGDFKKVWMTGYEILEGERSGCLRLDAVSGYSFRVERSTPKAHSALQRFVREFYAFKSQAKTDSEKYFYKLILNSLYGKFIQRIQDDEGRFVAGSMFDPAVASLITGFVRGKVHGLEHRFCALHTATDGIITQRPPGTSEIGPGIGALSQKVFGPCLILRNKLYIHFDNNGKIQKTGLHGFEGNAEDLERLWKSSKRIYHIKRLVKWAEAWHIGLPPGLEITRKKMLNLKV